MIREAIKICLNLWIKLPRIMDHFEGWCLILFLVGLNESYQAGYYAQGQQWGDKYFWLLVIWPKRNGYLGIFLLVKWLKGGKKVG